MHFSCADFDNDSCTVVSAISKSLLSQLLPRIKRWCPETEDTNEGRWRAKIACNDVEWGRDYRLARVKLWLENEEPNPRPMDLRDVCLYIDSDLSCLRLMFSHWGATGVYQRYTIRGISRRHVDLYPWMLMMLWGLKRYRRRHRTHRPAYEHVRPEIFGEFILLELRRLEKRNK